MADKPSVTKTDFNLDESLRVGYGQRPELLAARANLDGRQVQRKIAENRSPASMAENLELGKKRLEQSRRAQ